MSASTFRLVFQGKIAPNEDLAEVKSRLQKLFKKDAATIDKMFSGKKIPIKQGLNQGQALQYKEKMRSLGVLCEIESQMPQSKSNSTYVAPTTSGTPSSQHKHQNIADNSPTSAEQSPLKLADIDKAFTGTVPKVELPNSYKAGIVAVGIAMVLLPLIYVGLIAVLGYSVLSHAVSNGSWIQSLGYKFGVIAYITPIVAGLTVILFMIKPLFARPVAAATTIKLDPLKEPIFFHFVNKIAMAVGAPRPKQIEVDCQVNASASFRKGLFSFFGDDLVLTIGMPLLDGFNARQLAGVLAHEFGHFSQGVGMRFHYLTYKVNSWFFNAVYLRDSWDEKLEQVAEEADGWISVVLNAARGGVWATRKVLYGFMMAGHAVSSYMLRQMEFDADRYEAHMAGSQQFRDTTLRLQRLGVAFQVSHDQLAQAWEDKKLVDNLPRLIVHNAEQLPEELDHALLSQMREKKTQVYDSHPSDNERIENAMAQQARGVFELPRASRDLFKSFDVIAKQVSNSYYAHELGLEFDRNKLIDVNQVVQITRENEKQQEAYHQYFKDMTPVFELPISVNIFDTSKVDWDDLAEQYRQVNEQIVDQIGQRRHLMVQANDSYDKYQKLRAIDVFRECGFVMFPEWFGMDEQTFAKYREMIPKLEQTWQHAMQQLNGMFELNDQRLSIALTLLNHPKLIDKNTDHAQHLKTRNRLSLLINNIKRNAEYITDFEFKHFKLAALLTCAPLMGQKPEPMPGVVKALVEDVKQAYEQLNAAMGRLDYPFVAEGEHLTIADYIAEFLTQKNHAASEVQFYMHNGTMILEKLESIYARIISGLANIALSIDQLIPSINDEQVANVQVQVQQVVAAGPVADVQSNLAYKYVEESVSPVSHPASELESDSDLNSNMVSDASRATEFTNSEADLSEVNEEQSQDSGAEDVEGTSSVMNAMISTPPVSEIAPRADSILPALELSSAEPLTGEIADAAPVTESGAKAVFAIDESMDAPEEKAEQKEVKPISEPSVKAVFKIDDTDDDDKAEQIKVVSANQSNGKAVFAIDDSAETVTDEDNHEADVNHSESVPLPHDTNPEAGLAFVSNKAALSKETADETNFTKQQPINPSKSPADPSGLTLESVAEVMENTAASAHEPESNDVAHASEGSAGALSLELTSTAASETESHSAAAETVQQPSEPLPVAIPESTLTPESDDSNDEAQVRPDTQETDTSGNSSGATLSLESVDASVEEKAKEPETQDSQVKPVLTLSLEPMEQDSPPAENSHHQNPESTSQSDTKSA
ncbi:M48 family metalloprotease [Kaarinaea lacus]